MVGAQGRLDGAQFSRKFLGESVGVLGRHRMARSFGAGEFLQGGRQAGIHTGEGPAVRFIHAVHIAVGGAFRQRLHVGRAVGQHR
jgi:hypothetical protein